MEPRAVSAPPLIATDRLRKSLRLLCGQPSHPGQRADLVAASDLVATLLRSLRMQVTVVQTDAAPVVIGRRSGRSPTTLLLYHHYDVAPPGPWRAWSHEPYQLAERDDALYGRGVAHGKGPLVAHIEALHALLQAEGELPCGVVLVVEGAALLGSTGLASAIAERQDLLAADYCLGSAGDRDAQGRPFCYSGSKGMLQARLSVRGLDHPLASGLATSVRNPIWRLISALTHIKGDDEDIKIGGFYDAVEGPTREENIQLRKLSLDEAGRHAAWQTKEFLFGLQGSALLRAEVTLPTCNLSAISSEPTSDLPALPAAASALLEFQLVPSQQPAAILALLREHLSVQGFDDVLVEPLPGGYPPARSTGDRPLAERLSAAGATVYDQPLSVLQLGPFAQPLNLFATALGTPVGAIGLADYTSAVRGPDEHIRLEHLLRHGQILIELMRQL
jgi:acetylornithine deacetylase/succinyl-diaminopimelate desuccinylase-like protein